MRQGTPQGLGEERIHCRLNACRDECSTHAKALESLAQFPEAVALRNVFFYNLARHDTAADER